MDYFLQASSMQLFARLGLFILISLGGLLLIIILVHTLYILGVKGLIYRKRPPIAGWSMQFYSTTIILLIFISALGVLVYRFT